MARLIPGVTTGATTARHADPLTDLNLLLDRLQRTILRADAEREQRLRASEFEREKAQANVSYARSLLTRLEQDASAIKIHARRHDVQADLVRKKEILDQLSERLSDLAEIAAAGIGRGGADADADADANANANADDTSDGEDILADIIATPSESMDSSRSPDMPPEEPDDRPEPMPDDLEPPPPPPPAQPREEETVHEEAPPKLPESPPASSPHPTSTSQTLRPRRHGPTPTPEATTTATATASATPAPQTSPLFGPSSPAQPTSPSTAPTTSAGAAIPTSTEAVLDHHRAEQDALSESILKLAAELKASSQAFSASLEEDRELVERAGQGIARTSERMEAVTAKMGTLQRMAEAEGWWGRMRLYAIIYGLMVVLVLVVFVLPKLRF